MYTVALTPEKFDQYVTQHHPEANFLQSSSWGKVYELNHDTTHYIGFAAAQTDQLFGAALAIVKPARRGRYLEIPAGPLLNWQSPSEVKFAIAALKQLAQTEHCVFVRLRPNLPDSPQLRKTLARNHLRPSPMHLHAEHTVMLDLTKPLDDLLKDMRRQTRYEVRRADKLGIKVTSSTTTQAFKTFYQHQLGTAKRQNFVPSPESFILAQHTAFADHAKIYTASLKGKTLATALILTQPPEVIYHEAASTPENRSLPGAYALQWQVIQDAKALGLKRYNLFGTAPPHSPRHRYAGVTTFKTGFGGTTVSYIPAYDLIIDPLKYQLAKLIETIRKKKRNL